MSNRTLAIIQARMASSRLPGKVLLDISGEPMLVRVVDRSRRAETVDEVIVATTSDPSDALVADLCAQRGYLCYRGSQHDVLDRYYQTANLHKADVIVRVTADCPIIDPDVIDETVNYFSGKLPSSSRATSHESTHPWDFAANRLPPPWNRTFPIGLDTEVCSFEALKLAWSDADQPHQREHVMPYLYEDSPIFDSQNLPGSLPPDQKGKFRVLLVNHDLDYSAHRWTVDTANDLELLRQIYNRFDPRDDFSWLEVLDLFEREPELAEINAQERHKTAFDIDERN
jgi:spore coat polysaccharide biosynthesis protein SpsF